SGSSPIRRACAVTCRSWWSGPTSLPTSRCLASVPLDPPPVVQPERDPMAKEKLHARRGAIAIVGAAESDELGKLPGKSALMLHAEGARNALADAGLTAKDVDAVLATGRSTANEVPEYLGIRPRYLDNTQMGGCSFIAHLEHALGAIDAGVAEV